MSPAQSASTGLVAMRSQMDGRAKRHMLITFAAFFGVAVYCMFSFIQFDIGDIARKWSPDRAWIFLLDTYAHKDHVTMRWKDPTAVEVAFEGGYRHKYDTPPAWFQSDPSAQTHIIQFDNGGHITFYSDAVVLANWPGTKEDFTFRRTAEGTPYVDGYRNRLAELPDWIRVTENKVEVRPSLYERLQVYRSKVEVHRYEVGWKYFWFDFNSPLRGHTLWSAMTMAFSSDSQADASITPYFVLREFLDNDLWHHGTVLFALLETVLMALLGTMLACIVGLPLAFLAAYNITPFRPLRFILRRLFDFLRGIDVLIWSLIFLRAFGPGLFTGIFAIAFTDTGTFGKLMSEAVENTDAKQREGVQSTGASRIQQHRFGIIPQILPVFISQSLYYLESNTRGAVIIGAMGAGGIGLQFLGALQTGNDFENVAYMAVLVLLTVIVMDSLSAKLRRALIGIDKKS